MRASRPTRTFRLDAAATLCAFLVIATSCGAPTPVGTNPASAALASALPGTSWSAVPSAASTGGSVLSAEELAALDHPTLEQLAEQEAKIDAALAERSGLTAALGSEGIAWLAERRSIAVKAGLDAGGIRYASRLPGSRLAGSTASVDGGIALGEAGGALFGAITAVALTMAGRMEGGYGNSGTIAPAPTEQTSERTIGGKRISTTDSFRYTATLSGSSMTVDSTLAQQVTTYDASTGAVLGRSSHSAHVHAEANGCPDASGVVPIRVDAEISEDASGSGGSSVRMRVQSTTRVQVGDDAWIKSQTEDATYDYETAAGGTSRRSTAKTSITMTLLPGGALDPSVPTTGTGTSDDGDVPPQEAAGARILLKMATIITVSVIVSTAQEKWRAGACVRVEATEHTRNVQPNDVVSFTAKPVHKVDGTDLDKPVVAAFAGKVSVAPVDTPQRPPAALTYTAPEEDRQTGTITLTSTSNRGIGTLVIEFRTAVTGWMIDQPSGGGRIKGQHCGTDVGEWLVNGTYDRGGSKGKQKWVIEMEVDDTGTYVYTDDAVQTLGGVTVKLTGRATGKVTVTFDANARALMHFSETTHTYRATVPGGHGQDQNAPLEEFDMAWEVDTTCTP